MTLLFPGFFSQPDDYRDLRRELQLDHQIFDYSGLESIPLSELGARINERIKKPIFAIGYSMGGRVLLAALNYNPKNFKAVSFVSTCPGLKTQIDREQRLAADKSWAEKFQKMPWDQLVQEWNSQAVFSGKRKPPIRLEKSFDRKALGEILINWSLGAQKDYRSLIAGLSVPNLWVAGAYDNKFCSFLKDVNEGKKTQTRVIADSGHRVHLDQPEALAKVIRPWIS